MLNKWKYFFAFRLPIALVSLAVATEIVSLALEPIKLRRHDLDDLAILTDRLHSPHESNIVLLGDSVTQDVLKIFQIGPENKVANLTTNKANGMIGAYFLLERYLHAHPKPDHVVFASTPEFFAFLPKKEVAEVYVTSVFKKKKESALIESLLGIKKPAFTPAFLNIDQRIGLKIISLFATKLSGFPMGDRKPDSNLKIQEKNIPHSLRVDILKRSKRTIKIPPENKHLIARTCELASIYKFQIHFIHAPVAKTIADSWRQKGILKEFEKQRNNIIEDVCKNTLVKTNFNLQILPDYALRDSDHLVRHHGTNAYAVRLDTLLRNL